MARMKGMLLATALMIAAAQSNDPFRTPRRNTGVRRNDNQRKPKPVVRELREFLNHSGAGTPVFDFKSFEEMRDRVKVGDTVRVRFEEFGMPDKHVVGRMVLPKRAYRVIKIDERRGQHLSGKDLEEGKVRKFHIEQIIEVL